MLKPLYCHSFLWVICWGLDYFMIARLGSFQSWVIVYKLCAEHFDFRHARSTRRSQQGACSFLSLVSRKSEPCVANWRKHFPTTKSEVSHGRTGQLCSNLLNLKWCLSKVCALCSSKACMWGQRGVEWFFNSRLEDFVFCMLYTSLCSFLFDFSLWLVSDSVGVCADSCG